MAPDIPKIDPDRHPNLGDAAWNFGDEVLRWFFHGHSLSDSKDLLIPFFGNFISHSAITAKGDQASHSFYLRCECCNFLWPFSAQKSLVKSKIPQL